MTHPFLQNLQYLTLECGELAHDGKLPLSEWLTYLFKFF